MGWERRKNGYYLYRKERQGGRVRSVYVGRGDFAELLDRSGQILAEGRAAERRLDAKRIAEDARPLDEAEALVDAYSKRCSAILRAALLASGRYRHRREWRKRRGSGERARRD